MVVCLLIYQNIYMVYGAVRTLILFFTVIKFNRIAYSKRSFEMESIGGEIFTNKKMFKLLYVCHIVM